MTDKENESSKAHQPLKESNPQADKDKVAQSADRKLVNHEDPLMPTSENVLPTILATTTTKGLSQATDKRINTLNPVEPIPAKVAKLARTTGAQVATVADVSVEATSVVAEKMVEAVNDVGKAMKDSAQKASKELDESDDASLGPYSSLGTCAPSDMDPLAEAVHSGLSLKDNPLENETIEVERGGAAGSIRK